MKPLIQRLTLRQNQFFFLNQTWQKNPVQYYHAHEGIELLYIHEGAGRLILEDRLYTLQPRTLIFFQPYQLHLLHYQFPYLRSIIKFKASLLEPYSCLLPNLFEFISFLEKSSMNQQVFQLDSQQDEELTSQISSLEETLRTFPVHEHKEQFHVFMLKLLSYLKSRIFDNVQSREKYCLPRPYHHVETIQQWVAMHFRQPFDLNKLAADIHLSASYLSNLFRQYTGITITQCITNRRLEEACLQLQATSLPVDQIGKNSGFPNAAYFSRSFKKNFGITPLQYRLKATQPFGAVDSSRETR